MVLHPLRPGTPPAPAENDLTPFPQSALGDPAGIARGHEACPTDPVLDMVNDSPPPPERQPIQASVGEGKVNRPADVLAIRARLCAMHYLSADQRSIPTWDAGAAAALRLFQHEARAALAEYRHGREDGVVNAPPIRDGKAVPPLGSVLHALDTALQRGGEHTSEGLRLRADK